jgi:hypothetical protein
MDIKEFFELSAGKWFSQRSSHHPAAPQSAGDRSTLQFDLLDKTDPTVIQACQQSKLDPAGVVCGLRITWDGTVANGLTKQAGSLLLVPVADAAPNQGKLLRQKGAEIAIGTYHLGADEALTMVTETMTPAGQRQIEERFWYASPNLRLRTNIMRDASGLSMSSFATEIRMGVTKPPEG